MGGMKSQETKETKIQGQTDYIQMEESGDGEI